MKTLQPKRTACLIAFAILVTIGLSVSRWISGTRKGEISRLDLPNQTNLAQVVDGENLIDDWIVADAFISVDNVLVVTVSAFKKLGKTTNLKGKLAIFLRGQKVLDCSFENEILGSDVGSRSFVLRSTDLGSCSDLDPQELQIQWTPSRKK